MQWSRNSVLRNIRFNQILNDNYSNVSCIQINYINILVLKGSYHNRLLTPYSILIDTNSFRICNSKNWLKILSEWSKK